LTHGYVITLPEGQGCEVSDFPIIVASQWDGNPAFTVHTVWGIAHAFRAAIKLTQCYYQGCAEGHERGYGPGHPKQWAIQKVKLQKVHLSKSCN